MATADKRNTLRTRRLKFFSCNPNCDSLFSVNPGLSANDALEIASCFLTTALGSCNEMAKKHDSDVVWVSVYLVEISKAIVDAAIRASDEESPV